MRPAATAIPNPHLYEMYHSGAKLASFRNLHPSELSFQKIANLITNESIVIENIVEVYNPRLKKAYNMKKKQKKAVYGNVTEDFFFHGTKKENVDLICSYNFDWRLHGQNTGHRFGKGVSFTPNAKYASHYSDESDHKVMIVAKVLIGQVCGGHNDMDYPPLGFDTSQKNDGMVVVKYDDNEFLPMYKLYYHIDEDYYCDDDSYDEDEEGYYDDEDEDGYYDDIDSYYDDIDGYYDDYDEDEDDSGYYGNDYDDYYCN